MKKVLFFILLSFVVLELQAQNPDRSLTGFELDNGRIIIKANDGNYHISFYDENVLETQFVPKADDIVNDSHAVITSPVNVDIKVKNHKNKIVFNTSGIDVHLMKRPFQILYFRGSTPIISEGKGYQQTKDGGFDLEFNLTETEVLMGGGARALSMDRRGHKLKLYNRAHYGYETRTDELYFAHRPFLKKIHGPF